MRCLLKLYWASEKPCMGRGGIYSHPQHITRWRKPLKGQELCYWGHFLLIPLSFPRPCQRNNLLLQLLPFIRWLFCHWCEGEEEKKEGKGGSLFGGGISTKERPIKGMAIIFPRFSLQLDVWKWSIPTKDKRLTEESFLLLERCQVMVSVKAGNCAY